MFSSLNNIEAITFRYGRKSRLIKKIGLGIKRRQINRHWMRKADVAIVEEDPAQMGRILEKYLTSEKDYLASLKERMVAYSKKANIKIDAETEKDILFSSLAYGFTTAEYFSFHLKEKSFEDRKTFLSDRERLLLIYQVNDIVNMQYARNKQLTYSFFKEFYKRDALAIHSKNDLNAFLAFVDKHPVFVQKSGRMNCGQGVMLINISETGCSKEAYFHKLITDNDILLEEPVKQTVLSEFNASSVNTVRCGTCIKNGEAIIKYCTLRTGRSGSFMDNLAAGGIGAGIDLETGTVITDGVTEFGEVFQEHPDTHTVYKEFQIPDWAGLCSFVAALALKLPDVRCVGWDLAYTEKGWCLVEANARLQFFSPQLLYQRGIKSEFLDALNVADLHRGR